MLVDLMEEEDNANPTVDPIPQTRQNRRAWMDEETWKWIIPHIENIDLCIKGIVVIYYLFLRFRWKTAKGSMRFN